MSVVSISNQCVSREHTRREKGELVKCHLRALPTGRGLMDVRMDVLVSMYRMMSRGYHKLPAFVIDGIQAVGFLRCRTGHQTALKRSLCNTHFDFPEKAQAQLRYLCNIYLYLSKILFHFLSSYLHLKLVHLNLVFVSSSSSFLVHFLEYPSAILRRRCILQSLRLTGLLRMFRRTRQSLPKDPVYEADLEKLG